MEQLAREKSKLAKKEAIDRDIARAAHPTKTHDACNTCIEMRTFNSSFRISPYSHSQIHRYENENISQFSFKMTEERKQADSDGFYSLCALSELESGKGKRFSIGDDEREIAVFKVSGERTQLHAVDAHCYHSGILCSANSSSILNITLILHNKAARWIAATLRISLVGSAFAVLGMAISLKPPPERVSRHQLQYTPNYLHQTVASTAKARSSACT